MEAYTQAISSNVEPVRSHAGADGHLLDFHANGSEKTLFVCALIARRTESERGTSNDQPIAEEGRASDIDEPVQCYGSAR